MMKRLKIKKILIVILIIISIFLLAPAYAYFNQTLSVDGIARISSPAFQSESYTNLYYSVNQYRKQGNTYYYDLNFTIENIGNNPVYNWNIIFSIPNNATISEVNNVAYTLEGKKMTIRDNSNNSLLPGEKFSFRILYSSATSGVLPTEAYVNDVSVELEALDAEFDDPQILLDLQAIPTITKKNGKYKYNINIAITNLNDQAINTWEAKLLVPTDAEISSFQNVNYVNKISYIVLTNVNTNATINPNQTINVSIEITTDDGNYVPVINNIVGKPVEMFQ